MKLQLCHYAGCEALSAAYYCPKHRALAEQKRQQKKIFSGTQRKVSAEYNSLYHTQRWKEERKAFLSKYFLCVRCGEKATVVDHIRPHRGNEALFWDQNNWQPLCNSCHSRKTLEENNFFRGRGR